MQWLLRLLTAWAGVALSACASTPEFLTAQQSFERSRKALQPLAGQKREYSDVDVYNCAYDGERIVYTGNTTIQLVNCLLGADNNVERLVITSRGGAVDEAVFAAYLVGRMQLDVEVVGQCVSSCANYILPAAARIHLDRHSVVSVHGSPAPPDRDRMIEAFAKAGWTSERPDFEEALDRNLLSSEETFRLHTHFAAEFNVGRLYYDVAKVHAFGLEETGAASIMIVVDPDWLAACIPDVQVIAEQPDIEGLASLFVGHHLVTYSSALGRPGNCN